jgi:hypothetical protein
VSEASRKKVKIECKFAEFGGLNRQCFKSGTTSIPGRVHPGRGTQGSESGIYREIRDVWQPFAR